MCSRFGVRDPAWTPIIGLFIIGCVVLNGCAGYRIGPQSLYRPDIGTIYVPVFESESFRRNLGEWLTEAVIKEIEHTTTYKVVGHPGADSTLEGRIVAVGKRVLSENVNDEPQDIELGFRVHIRWIDPRGRLLIERTFGMPAALVRIAQNADLVPIAGQSIVTAEQDAIQRLATEIVGQMEILW